MINENAIRMVVSALAEANGNPQSLAELAKRISKAYIFLRGRYYSSEEYEREIKEAMRTQARVLMDMASQYDVY